MDDARVGEEEGGEADLIKNVGRVGGGLAFFLLGVVADLHAVVGETQDAEDEEEGPAEEASAAVLEGAVEDEGDDEDVEDEFGDREAGCVVEGHGCGKEGDGRLGVVMLTVRSGDWRL